MPSTPTIRRVIAATACGAALVPVALSVGAHAQAGPTTITFQEPRGKVVLQHLQGGKGDAVKLGDRFVGGSALFDAAKNKVGKVGFDCAVMETAPKFFLAQLECTVTYSTAQGDIVAAGFYKLDGSQTMPVVGGTGSYAGAHGTLGAGKPAAGYDSADVITLQP